MRHVNIPVFIPHLGCPNTCVFCNQRTISGVRDFEPKELSVLIDTALSTVDKDDEVEIAFFGGSFTGIDRRLMISLLEISYSYVKDGRVSGIRCSTRPDYIDEEVLLILKRYGVRVIELGLQSVSEKVLSLTKRGHSFEDELRACRLIVDGGFDLVGQMMIGLPGSTVADELETAKFIIDSGAVGARIYPTVVFCDTELAEMCRKGEYSSLMLEEAVERSAKAFGMFLESGVEVIRIGLCSSENLSSRETYFEGPNHPALGELVISRYYFEKILDGAKIYKLSGEDTLTVGVAPGSLSKAIGQKKINKIKLKEKLGVREVRIIEDPSVSGYGIKLETEAEVQKCI